jgi:Ca2+-binding EF-hand superfamily protein
MRRWVLSASAALTLGVAVPAMAQQPAPDQQQAERIQKRRAAVRHNVRERWQRLDKDGNGSISRDEWVRDPQTFDRLDANKDGVLSREELGQAVQQRIRQRADDRWKRLDKDGNGSISREEWPRNPEAFDRLDTNKDGLLTGEELTARAGSRRRR